MIEFQWEPREWAVPFGLSFSDHWITVSVLCLHIGFRRSDTASQASPFS